jgi:hypothetical protein
LSKESQILGEHVVSYLPQDALTFYDIILFDLGHMP